MTFPVSIGFWNSNAQLASRTLLIIFGVLINTFWVVSSDKRNVSFAPLSPACFADGFSRLDLAFVAMIQTAECAVSEFNIPVAQIFVCGSGKIDLQAICCGQVSHAGFHILAPNEERVFIVYALMGKDLVPSIHADIQELDSSEVKRFWMSRIRHRRVVVRATVWAFRFFQYE